MVARSVSGSLVRTGRHTTVSATAPPCESGPVGSRCAPRMTLAEAVRSAAATHDHTEGIRGRAGGGAGHVSRPDGSREGCDSTEVETQLGYDLSRTLGDIRPGYTFDVTCQGSVPERSPPSSRATASSRPSGSPSHSVAMPIRRRRSRVGSQRHSTVEYPIPFDRGPLAASGRVPRGDRGIQRAVRSPR